ncbi:MAG: HAD hydrolase-like protein [Fimbriimonadales bacterium]
MPTGSALSLFDGNFDTLVGPKREAASYAQIAMHVGLHPHEMLFVSDVIEEVVAAREAGLRAVLISRPEEGKASPPDAIASFAEIP